MLQQAELENLIPAANENKVEEMWLTSVARIDSY